MDKKIEMFFKLYRINKLKMTLNLTDNISYEIQEKLKECITITKKYQEIWFRTKNDKKVNKIINHPKNLGKGASIKSAIKYANGEIILIQDADLEYDPINYYNLVDPIVKNQALVVYGSRVLNKSRYINAGFVNFYRVFFNHILTILSNFINNQKLTDAHTCYKVFKKVVFDKINLLENDFSFCPEVTTKVAKLGYQIKEVEISYKGRNYNEGKKINLYDGVKAIYVLFKYGIFNRYFN